MIPLPCTPIFDTPPADTLQFSVVIPVRDESVILPRALAALTAQVDLNGQRLDPARYEILVLANNCRDETATVARRYAQNYLWPPIHVAEQVLSDDQANVGTARQLLMDEAYRRLQSVERPQGVIASTDGDTIVARDWVAQTLREVAAGADAVGGRIFVDGHEDAGGRRYHLRDITYHHLAAHLESLLDPDPTDPWPSHHQFFGGSLAVTAAVYRAAGGLPGVPCLEDVALQRALRRIDARLRHSPNVRVTTSARQCGRATLGLASQLREWSEMAYLHTPHLVQDPMALSIRFQSRAKLRQHWRDAQMGLEPTGGELALLADKLCVPLATLAGDFAHSYDSFGKFWEQIAHTHDTPDGAWAQRWPLLPIETAITDLRARLFAQTRRVDSSPRADR